jgi:hypothetical protein
MPALKASEQDDVRLVGSLFHSRSVFRKGVEESWVACSLFEKSLSTSYSWVAGLDVVTDVDVNEPAVYTV